MVKQISDNEIYLLIKYIKSVLWRVAKCLSYIEEARCLKVKKLNEGPTMIGMALVFQGLPLLLDTSTFFVMRKIKTYASSGGKYGSFSLEQLHLEILMRIELK